MWRNMWGICGLWEVGHVDEYVGYMWFVGDRLCREYVGSMWFAGGRLCRVYVEGMWFGEIDHTGNMWKVYVEKVSYTKMWR